MEFVTLLFVFELPVISPQFNFWVAMNCNPGINSICIYKYKNLIANKVKTRPSWVTFNSKVINMDSSPQASNSTQNVSLTDWKDDVEKKSI